MTNVVMLPVMERKVFAKFYCHAVLLWVLVWGQIVPGQNKTYNFSHLYSMMTTMPKRPTGPQPAKNGLM